LGLSLYYTHRARYVNLEYYPCKHSAIIFGLYAVVCYSGGAGASICPRTVSFEPTSVEQLSEATNK